MEVFGGFAPESGGSERSGVEDGAVVKPRGNIEVMEEARQEGFVQQRADVEAIRCDQVGTAAAVVEPGADDIAQSGDLEVVDGVAGVEVFACQMLWHGGGPKLPTLHVIAADGVGAVLGFEVVGDDEFSVLGDVEAVDVIVAGVKNNRFGVGDVVDGGSGVGPPSGCKSING